MNGLLDKVDASEAISENCMGKCGGLLCGAVLGFRVSWIWSYEQYKAVSSALKMVLVSD